MPDSRLVKGQGVRVRLAASTDEWCAATVAIASQNGQSVGLLLDGDDGVVRTSGGGRIFGALPLMVDYAAGTVTSLLGDEYEIEVQPSPQSSAGPSGDDLDKVFGTDATQPEE